MQPFIIETPQYVLDNLQYRLQHTRWTDEPRNAEWNYGTNPFYLRSLVEYWKTQFDWRKQEKLLNTFPQFKTKVDGIGIHFIHIKSKTPGAKPLLLSHGWPDSFFRFYKVIPKLSQTFDVIVPSIPGFGFSDLVSLAEADTAGVWKKLMVDVLGYQSFFAAGGDIGAIITRHLARSFPQYVKAIHVTDVDYPNGSEDWSKYSPAEQEFGKAIQQWWMTEGAYNMIQSTKPQTLGYGLNDSPVGLASWIIEKFYTWPDSKGNIESRFTKDELLTNIMIYWVTQTINTSIRTYLESARSKYSNGAPQPEPRIEVPTAVAHFPAEAPMPKEWAERMVNLKRFREMPVGGHFAALEVPELYLNDLVEFFRDY